MERQPLPLVPLVACLAIASTAALPLVARADGRSGGGTEARLRATVAVRDAREGAVPVNANLYDRQLGYRVQTDFPSPARLTEHLRVRPGTSVVVHLGTSASGVSVGLADHTGSAIGRRAAALRIRVKGRVWRVRLPRRVPSRADRLSIGVEYRDTSTAGFEAGIRLRWG